jgi:hypothetical protein
MRFYDTERLLPDATSPFIKGTSPYTFKADFSATVLDSTSEIELGYSFNGAGPLYMASALYATDRYTSGAVQTMIQPQIAPLLNGGLKPGSFKYTIDGLDLEEFYGTYYQGWREQEHLGYVVPNPVGGHGFTRYNEVHRATFLWSQRAARFKGAWAAYAGKNATRLKLTVCGYYAGLSDVGGSHKWKIGQGNASDSGLAYARASGFRTKLQRAPRRPFQIARSIWREAMRMLRAYTGFVVQSAGSADFYTNVYFLANGCWEQVYASDFYPRGLEFERIISASKWLLGGQGAKLFHMAELLHMSDFESRLSTEALHWNGDHGKCHDGLYKTAKQPFSSFNGTSAKGTLIQEIDYVDLADEDAIAMLAKCKNLVGGYRSVKVKVVDSAHLPPGTSKSVVSEISGDVVFNGGCIEAAHPDTTSVVIENIFAVNCGVNAPSDDELLNLGTASAPATRQTLEDRLLDKVVPSIETFPNSDEIDDGILPAITDVQVALNQEAMMLTITTADGRMESVPFMPVATLLIESRDACIKAHNAAATGNYGYGYLDYDPYGKKEGLYIVNTVPGLSAYSAQERWHVPYKRLVALAYEKATGTLPTAGFTPHDTAALSPYIYKAVSDVISDNRYTKYDMHTRPPTFLPLFMCAEVCHEYGATAFARELAKGLVTALSISQVDNVITFGKPAPSWATDPVAFYESIVTLLLMGGYQFDSYVQSGGVTTEVVVTRDDILEGSTSDDFWLQIAKVTGLDSVSDVVTHYGVTEGIVNVPSTALIAAAVKDPIAFGASMGIRVVPYGEGYLIGSRTFETKADVVVELTRIAERVVATDSSNTLNIATSLGMPDMENIPANPKQYAEPFNWLLLLPHAVTAIATIGAKISERYGK